MKNILGYIHGYQYLIDSYCLIVKTKYNMIIKLLYCNGKFTIPYLIQNKDNMFQKVHQLNPSKRRPRTISKHIQQYQFCQSSPRLQNKKQQNNIQNHYKKYHKQKQSMIKSQHHSNKLSQYQIISAKFQSHSFQNTLSKQIDELIYKLENNQNIIQNDLSRYQHVQQTDAQIRAFKQCMFLIQNQFTKLQTSHNSQIKLLQKKILQVQDYKHHIIKQIHQLRKNNTQIQQQNTKLQQQYKIKLKQQQDKKYLKQKIYQQHHKIIQFKNNLLLCKQKSYQQKNQFILIQSQQFQLQNLFYQCDQQLHLNQSNYITLQKYQQLAKIKQKIILSVDCTQAQIKPHLQRKIQKMSKLQTELINIQQILQQCSYKIEDQNITIDALKQKLYHQQLYQKPIKQNNLYHKFKNQYSQLYFGKLSSSNDEWKTYNTYLKHLIHRNQNINSSIYPSQPINSITQQLKIQSSNDIYHHSNKNNYKKIYHNGFDINPNNKQKLQHQNPLSKKDQRTKLPKIKTQVKTNSDDQLADTTNQQYQIQTKTALQTKQFIKNSSIPIPQIPPSKTIPIPNLTQNITNSSSSIPQQTNPTSSNLQKKPQSQILQQQQSYHTHNSQISGQLIPIDFIQK